MRLSDVLSKPPTEEYIQVEGFMGGSKLNPGKQRNIEIGNIGLNYHCENCGDLRTFWTNSPVHCLGVDEKTISLDLHLDCYCGSNLQVWFLIESERKIIDYAPTVRITKKSERLGSSVSLNKVKYGEETFLIEKADRAHREGLGAGSMVYLRIIYEQVTKRIAQEIDIDLKKKNGSRKTFKNLLIEVDEAYSIIPKEFKNRKYQLFGELSEIIHGNSNEGVSLSKYVPARRLIIGILDNIRNTEEIKKALLHLEWDNVESGVQV